MLMELLYSSWSVGSKIIWKDELESEFKNSKKFVPREFMDQKLCRVIEAEKCKDNHGRDIIGSVYLFNKKLINA